MNDLKTIFKKHGLKPNKIMGQNFLIDRQVLKKIIAAADLSKNDTVLEVGPGLGILTQELAKHAGKVIAVEKDKKMAEIVRNVLNDRNVRNVEIIQGDILKILNHKSLFLNQDFKVIANIPYYLTSRLIRKFLESENPPAAMILMLQKEVAQRICARPPKMSLLAVSVQFYAQPKIIAYVSKNSFWPRPKVDSAIIKIVPHNNLLCHSRPCFRRGKLVPAKAGSGNPDVVATEIENSGSRIKCGMTNNARFFAFQKNFFLVLRAGFSHPRKQLINNLSRGLKIDREKVTETLKKIGLAPEQRAETLSVGDWINLAKQLSAVLR